MGIAPDTSSGLLGHFIGTVENSWAGTKSDYMDGSVTAVMWEVTVDDVLQEDFDNEVPESMSLLITTGGQPGDWETDENGILFHIDDESRREKGKEPKNFHVQSQYGKILGVATGTREDYGNSVVVLDGDDPEFDVDMTKCLDYWEDKGFTDARDPRMWTGFTFEFRGIGFEWRGMKGDPRQKPFPVRVVSLPSNGSGPNKTEAKTKFYDFTSIEGVDQDLANELLEALNTSRTHSAFVNKFIKDSRVKDNDALKTALASDEVWAGV